MDGSLAEKQPAVQALSSVSTTRRLAGDGMSTPAAGMHIADGEVPSGGLLVEVQGWIPVSTSLTHFIYLPASHSRNYRSFAHLLRLVIRFTDLARFTDSIPSPPVGVSMRILTLTLTLLLLTPSLPRSAGFGGHHRVVELKCSIVQYYLEVTQINDCIE